MQNYEPLEEGNEHGDNGMLIHVVAPSPTKRWDHVEDLDQFFTTLYTYHQRQGFSCILIAEVCELVNFIFVICLSVYVKDCIKYGILTHPPLDIKITLEDILEDPATCVRGLSSTMLILLCGAGLVFLILLVRSVYKLNQFWDAKLFYNKVLGIPDNELANVTWHEVQTKIRTAQLTEQMSIQHKELSDLDIYHRILRIDNYFVAMANKKLLPPRLQVPFIGEVVYWTPGLRYIIERILFTTPPWSPFEHRWKLEEVYKNQSDRVKLAEKLKSFINKVAFVTLLLSPLIFVWQIVYTFFTYAEMIKREPGFLSVRRWSLYGRLYLRHFNELDHELNSRLNRAHRPSTRYLASFNSPIVSVLARNGAFMLGSIISVMFALTLIDGELLTFDRGFLYMAVLGFGIAMCRGLIHDETLAWCPETLLSDVVMCIHYLPPGWQGQAHTTRVRKEFEQLFQLSCTAILENMLSPLITPYVLWRHVSPRSIDIVDFLRNFTVSVASIGDVCSFALMDIKKHGNPDWQLNWQNNKPTRNEEPVEELRENTQYTQGEDGKTELSLIHFTTTNPTWQPPPESQMYMQTVSPQNSVIYNEAGPSMSPHPNMPSPAPPYQSVLSYVDRRYSAMGSENSCDAMLRMNLWDDSICSSQNRMEGPTSFSAKSMSSSALILNDHRYRRGRNRRDTKAQENTPLLFNH